MSFSQAAGSPIPANIGGKDFQVGLITQAVKGKLEQLCKAEVRGTVLEDKDHLNDEEFKLAYGAFLDRVGSGDFKFGGPTHRKWMASPAGMTATVGICFNVSQEEAVSLMQSYPDEVGKIIEQVFAESFRPAPGK